MVLEQQLRNIPFFRSLPAEALEAIATRLALETYEQGQVVFRKGDPSDAMYLVQSGQVDVVFEDEATRDGDREPLATLGPGSFVGELGLLLDEPRSATLLVAADAELWALDRGELEKLLAEYPTIAIELTRELGRRLVATTRRIAPPAVTRFTAVWGEGAAHLAQALIEGHCGQIGILALPGSEPLPPLPAGVVVVDNHGLGPETLTGWARHQVQDLDHMLLVLPPESTGVSRAAVNLAEHLVAFDSTYPGWAIRSGLPHRVLRCDTSAPSLRRAARWVAGRAVGLAFSSGGSKCAAHIGVIRVLRETGIEIDAVAGTSGGAMAAAGYAFGITDSQIMGWVREMARNTKFRRFDLNFPPRSAIFKGVKLRTLFDTWTGGRTFADADIPLWMVAADVNTGEEVVIAEGPVSDGMRASMSIPGALNPWPYGGRMLIDGAVVNPLPASVLRDAGIRYVIGSTVAGQDKTFGTEAEARTPHLLQIMSRMMNSMEREMIKAQLPLVDVVIRPRVSATSAFDFNRFDAFIAEGQRAAREQLAEIKGLVSAPGH